jgi:cytidyltransferase-like protein
MINNFKTRIMVFGTFDVLHKGHLNFFRQARKLSARPYLIVSVARDINVKKIKGKKPAFKEKQRLAAVKKCRLVDKALLGGLKNHIPHILKQKPQIIALGYDQRAYVKHLKDLLRENGLKVRVTRLKAFYPETYKSSLFKAQKFD